MKRAISTAYYAVFHALCTICSDGIVGWSKTDLVADVYRALDHAGARKKLLGAGAAAIAPELPKFGASFQALQAKRHAADYASPSLQVTHQEALAAVTQARDALALIGQLNAKARTRLAILLLIVQRAL